MRHAFPINELPQATVARIFAKAILRLHRRSALILEVSPELSPDCLDVFPETSVTVVPAGLQKSSQRKGAQR
jgi:hypothetical protein